MLGRWLGGGGGAKRGVGGGGEVWVGSWMAGLEAKLVVHDSNIALNSGAVQNYKHLFGPSRALCFISESM